MAKVHYSSSFTVLAPLARGAATLAMGVGTAFVAVETR